MLAWASSKTAAMTKVSAGSPPTKATNAGEASLCVSNALNPLNSPAAPTTTMFTPRMGLTSSFLPSSVNSMKFPVSQPALFADNATLSSSAVRCDDTAATPPSPGSACSASAAPPWTPISAYAPRYTNSLIRVAPQCRNASMAPSVSSACASSNAATSTSALGRTRPKNSTSASEPPWACVSKAWAAATEPSGCSTTTFKPRETWTASGEPPTAKPAELPLSKPALVTDTA
mmetsp:Transcript_79254/g.242489  ORF Transcript_79254/g.242489 Transcript_79254/m.242489 type:complete len:231 (+) Transcript_79254:2151-2843(+)